MQVDRQNKKMNRKAALAVSLAALAGLNQFAKANSATWDGATADSFWNAPNWDFNSGPYTLAPGDLIFFDGTPATTNLNNNFAAGTTFAGMTFDNGATSFTINGNDFTLGTGSLVDNTGTASVSTQTFNVNVTAGAVVMGGVTDAQGGDNLIFNGNVTTGSLLVQTNSTVANTMSIATGKILTVNGSALIGNTSALNPDNTKLTVSGGGAILITGSLTVGQSDSNGSTRSATTVDLTGVTTLTLGSGTTSTLGIGTVAQAGGTLLLATNNIISVGTINVENPANGNASNGLLQLGSGTNSVIANTIILGAGKGVGSMQFAASDTTGQLVLHGQNNTATNFTIGSANSATAGTGTSALGLAGHNVTVTAGTVIVGQQAGNGNTSGVTGTGILTFDTGAFSVNTLQVGNTSSGTSNIGGNGFVTIGGANANTTATGVFTVNTAFSVSNNTDNTPTLAFASKGIFTINGGTANINSDITISNTSTLAIATAAGTINLNSGTLNMMGHKIGLAAASTNANVSLTFNSPQGGQTAALLNLGGTGIGTNTAGLTVNNGGTLILGGTNTYTGDTNVNSGILQISGNLTGSGNINNNAAVLFAPAVNTSITVSGAIHNGGQINVAGPGETKLTGNSDYGSDTNIDNGALAVNGSLNSGGNVNLHTSIGSGKLSGTGSVGNVNVDSDNGSNIAVIDPGASSADTSTGTLTMSNLTLNTGGNFRLDLDGAGAGSFDVVHVTGNTNFGSGAGITIAPGALSGTYTVIATDGSTSGTAPHLTSNTAGRSTFTLNTSNLNAIQITVSGSAGNLTWNGVGGTTWDINTTQNWNNNGTQDVFFDNDNVTFNDNNNGNYNVTLNTVVHPGTVAFANNTSTYTLSGTGGIAGSTGLTMSGSKTVILATNNSYTGTTLISSGTLQVGAGTTSGSLGSGTVTDNSVLAFNRSDSTTVAGSIGGSGSLVQSGTGTVILAANNSYGGATVINSGTLQVGAGTTTGSLGGGALTDNGTLAFNRSDTFSFNATIAGTGALAKNGAAVITLGGANTYAGPTIINGGTFIIGASNNIGDSTQATNSITLAGGALSSTAATLDLGVNRNIALGTGGGTLDVGSTNVLTVSGVVSGTTPLFKTGTGKLILTGNNSATSNETAILGGTVEVGNVNSLLASNGTVYFNSGTLHITSTMTAADTANKFSTSLAGSGSLSTGTFDIDNGVTFTIGTVADTQADIRTATGGGVPAGGGFTKAGLGTLVLNGNNAQLDSSFNLLAGTVVLTQANSGGGVGGGNSINFSGNGTVVLSNAVSTSFLNTTTLTQSQNFSVGSGLTGNIVIDAAGGAAGVTHSVGTITLNSSTLSVGFASAINSGTAGLTSIDPLNLTGDGTVIVAAAPGASTLLTLPGVTGAGANFTVGGAGNTTITAPVTAASASLNKNDAGVLTMTGNNTYSGVTNLNGGKTFVNGHHSGGGAYTIASAATLAGTGTIDSQVNVSSGGTVSPGSGLASGSLTVGSLSLSSSNLNFNLDGSGASQLDVSNADGLTVAGVSNVTLANLGGLNAGTYTLLDYNISATSPLADLSNFHLSTASLPGFTFALVNDQSNTSIDLQVTAGVVGPVNAQWANDVDGNWSDGTKWTGGTAPHSADDVANFGPQASAGHTVTLDVPETVGTVNFNSTGTYTIAGTNALTLDVSTGSAAINVIAGSHTISAPVVMNKNTGIDVATGSTLSISGNLTGSGSVALTKTSAGTLALKNLNTGSLNVNAGKVQISQKGSNTAQGGTNVIVQNLSIASTAQLDMTNNSMVIDYTGSVGTLVNDTRLKLQANLLTTSLRDLHHTLGYGDNALLNKASFNGTSVDSTSILVKYTYPGDTNLDGKVDVTDLGALSSHWQQSGVWTGGDFNYDGTVNVTDLGVLASNWQQGVTSPLLGANSFQQALEAVGLGNVAVPEPTMLGLLGMATMGLMSRRRRN